MRRRKKHSPGKSGKKGEKSQGVEKDACEGRFMVESRTGCTSSGDENCGDAKKENLRAMRQPEGGSWT